MKVVEDPRHALTTMLYGGVFDEVVHHPARPEARPARLEWWRLIRHSKTLQLLLAASVLRYCREQLGGYT